MLEKERSKGCKITALMPRVEDLLSACIMHTQTKKGLVLVSKFSELGIIIRNLQPCIQIFKCDPYVCVRACTFVSAHACVCLFVKLCIHVCVCTHVCAHTPAVYVHGNVNKLKTLPCWSQGHLKACLFLTWKQACISVCTSIIQELPTL
jgi:hypothetical protein